jgi:hypothetical protein
MVDPRYPAGEWLAAFILSLSSVCAIALTYGLALRVGGSRRQALLAAVLLFASSSTVIQDRHLYPYGAALALLLFSLWLALHPRDHPIRSALAGVLAGSAFLTYAGYWLLAAVVGAMHTLYRPGTFKTGARRSAAFAVGTAALPLALLATAAVRQHPLLQGMVDFSGTAVNGDFSEGWSLPWVYFWSTEGWLLALYAIGVIAVVIRSGVGPKSDHSIGGLLWLFAAVTVYAGLVLGSNGLHRFVVYDRLARQMLPFICLAAAAGLAPLFGRSKSMPVEAIVYATVLLLFSVNIVPVLTQRFPREVVSEVIQRYGADRVGLDTTILNSLDTTIPLFLPVDVTRSTIAARRFILVNAKDIWTDEQPPRWKPPPRGSVVLRTPHPRQSPSMQYHGYTPSQRLLLRHLDFSIQLIDTQPASP